MLNSGTLSVCSIQGSTRYAWTNQKSHIEYTNTNLFLSSVWIQSWKACRHPLVLTDVTKKHSFNGIKQIIKWTEVTRCHTKYFHQRHFTTQILLHISEFMTPLDRRIKRETQRHRSCTENNRYPNALRVNMESELILFIGITVNKSTVNVIPKTKI